jgi:MFS family permease
VLLAVCRLGQGIGLGGEWGGAVLLATENAPPGKRAWYGMFSQLGAPIGFLCSTGVFLLLTQMFDDKQFLGWAWRIPFLASAALVAVGLWVRLRIAETPDFQRAMQREERVRVPMAEVLTKYPGRLIAGTFGLISTFAMFYLMSVFALNWGTAHLGFDRERFLLMQMVGVLFFAATIPLAALYADRFGRRNAMIVATVLIIAFGFAFEPLFGAGSVAGTMMFLILGFCATGLTYGPCGATLAGIFPTRVRYTGASLAFNLGGILGASFAPYIATKLGEQYGVAAVGWYLVAMAVLTLFALLFVPRDK